MTPDEILDQLDDSIRKLNIEYNAFFAGGKPRPPSDIQWRVDNFFRMLGDNANLNFTQRFRFTQLQQRHGMLQQVWRRKLEVKERGARRPADRVLGIAGTTERPGSTGKLIALGKDSEADDKEIEQLYQAFLKLREQATNAPPPGSLQRFRAFLLSKAAEIRTEQAGAQVEASVALEEGKVKLLLKARK